MCDTAIVSPYKETGHIATESGHNGEEKQGYKAQTCMIGIRGMFSYTDRKNVTAELPLGGDSLKSLG